MSTSKGKADIAKPMGVWDLSVHTLVLALGGLFVALKLPLLDDSTFILATAKQPYNLD